MLNTKENDQERPKRWSKGSVQNISFKLATIHVLCMGQ